MDTNWHASAIKDLVETDLSIQEIADKYGRARDTILKLKKFHSVTRRLPPRKGPRAAVDMPAITPAHRALGIKITLFRGNRTLTEMAEALDVSRYVMKYMELGAHDFTLSQLLKLSDIMGQNINELITPIRAGGTPIPHEKTRW